MNIYVVDWQVGVIHDFGAGGVFAESRRSFFSTQDKADAFVVALRDAASKLSTTCMPIIQEVPVDP